jgi:glycolate oxidase
MGLAEAAKTELITLLGADHVLSSPEALERASRDETYGLEPSKPYAVLFPKTHEEVVGIAQICSKHDVVMTPRGAGTGKSGGCVPVHAGVVIDFSKLNRIVAVNQTDFTAVVEPGVILGAFQQHVESLGLYYPPDPASLEWCTLGGNVAENAGGPSAVKYGVTSNYVLGLRVVLSDGRSFRIGKNTIKGVTGLDLVSLMCGSEGLLAFVTEITLRLLAKPRFVLAAFWRFSSRQTAIEAVPKIRQSGAEPRSIEFVDAGSIEALRKTGKIQPNQFERAQALLLVEVDGNDEAQLLESLVKIDKVLSPPLEKENPPTPFSKGGEYLGCVIAQNEKERREFLEIRRGLSEATKRSARFKVSEDVVVPLSGMNAFLDDVSKLEGEHNLKVCAFGHAGDGNLHVQILFDDEAIKKRIPDILAEVFAKTIQHGGTLTGEHGVGIAKQPFLSLELAPDAIELQRQIKNVFDPRGLLNPGKFL